MTHRPLAFCRIAAAIMVPVPNGLVSTRACPACMAPLLIKLPSLAIPVTLKPADAHIAVVDLAKSGMPWHIANP